MTLDPVFSALENKIFASFDRTFIIKVIIALNCYSLLNFLKFRCTQKNLMIFFLDKHENFKC